ncbi:hypothetical protein M0R45_025266 [Rubus argutus]|uniref:Complex 1 LYR protein domain-containing protein n=1 Tax=Rubus argutus TaxID=59490 RepID=A0AAW1WXJ7_RUBAR
MGASSGPRLSGMQRQVLSLYRGFLRAARLKSADDRQKIESLISNEFRCNAKNVDSKNFLTLSTCFAVVRNSLISSGALILLDYQP